MNGNLKIASSLVIELTRRCNMNCAHCLRGCAQSIDISKKTINKVLKQYTNISTLTLTGGEPSLVPELIKYTVDRIIELGIDLGCLYIVTNGKVYSQKMVNAMRKAYAYSYEPDLCGLCVSVDDYHDGTHANNRYRYMDEPFFHTDKEQKDLSRYLINEGNAYDNGIGRRNLIVDTELKDEYVTIDEDCLNIDDYLVYVNALGDVLLNCDVSYQHQSDYMLGNVNDSSLVDILLAHII
jgi:hypothetical protein